MYKVVFIRHGESIWNKENLFTGWTDVDLSEKGREEATQAGLMLKEQGYSIRHRLHLGAQARDTHSVDRAGSDGPVVDSS